MWRVTKIDYGVNAGGTPHTTEEIDRVKKLINDLE